MTIESRAIPVADAFTHCPRCGTEAGVIGRNPFTCHHCDYQQFFGPTAAVAGIIVDQRQRVLFLTRQKNPGKGMLGLPGGFVDAEESVEDALVREAFEETGLRISDLSYVASFPNSYVYRGVALPVADMFFSCRATNLTEISIDVNEVAAWEFREATPETLDRMAFASNRNAVEQYLHGTTPKAVTDESA